MKMKKKAKKIHTSKEKIRVFKSGASRNPDTGKFDYEGFNSPIVDHSYAKYMHEHRKMEDGSMRASDNWQKGIPKDELAKSLVRHIQDFRLLHRGFNVLDEKGEEVTMEDCLNAIKFNSNGYILDLIKNSKIIRRGE